MHQSTGTGTLTRVIALKNKMMVEMCKMLKSMDWYVTVTILLTLLFDKNDVFVKWKWRWKQDPRSTVCCQKINTWTRRHEKPSLSSSASPQQWCDELFISGKFYISARWFSYLVDKSSVQGRQICRLLGVTLRQCIYEHVNEVLVIKNIRCQLY